MCGVLPSEAARARPVDREVVFLADVAARTERLLGRPASLPLVLSCSGRGNDLARDDQTRGGASTEPWSARELNDHHCQRLKEAAVAFGCNVDWSRTVRTDADPLYRSFVEWQMRVLRAQGKIKRCKRPTIFSVDQGTPVHDWRSRRDLQGKVKRYTGFRQELCTPIEQLPLPMQAFFLGEGAEQRATTRRCYVVSQCKEEKALERMEHQTSCEVDPDATLGMYGVLGRQCSSSSVSTEDGDDDESHDGDEWLAICSEDVATHMAHQGFTLAVDEGSGDGRISQPLTNSRNRHRSKA